MVDGNAIAMEGPDVKVGPNAATNLALLLHELGTNSLKYGALSASTGRVSLIWTAADLVKLEWIEKGGPTISGPPRAEGFGGTLSKMTAASLGGVIEREWKPDGLVMQLSIPFAPLAL
jgi:two-component sensor histidine kinase